MLTIRQHKGDIRGLTVTIVGDILHSRVARSNIFGLMTLGAKVRLCGPPTLLRPEFEAMGCELYYSLAAAIRDVDVIILHPGPMNRGIEIASGVADGPYSVMMNQVSNGVALRMAVLYQLIVPAAGIRGSELGERQAVPVLKTAGEAR